MRVIVSSKGRQAAILVVAGRPPVQDGPITNSKWIASALTRVFDARIKLLCCAGDK
jgi:hypothetical protein